ncbi:MAG: EAL domain-containing protein, partial [Anaerotignaceae bacterium]
CNSFLKKLESALALEKISIGNDNTYSLHVSAGVAYYPSDSTEKNQLIQFADFAMYQGKRNVKGRFTNFNRAVYDKEELRIKRKEALNKIIEGNAIDYFFQPIICAKTGIVFAYEALMRPQNDLLRSPLDVLNVAKEENRLIDIETMTMFSATKSFIHWCESGVITNPQCKLFINSITSVVLSEEQLAYYESDYSNYLSRLVVEYTEEEKAIGELLSLKQNILKKWGGQIALDDYGSGYNGETMLLETDVQYIKVDINMIKNIHISDNRKQRVMDLLNYAHSRGILVVAEGIESKEEFNALQELGVDFLQGYYFAKPALVPPTPNLENLFAPKEVGKTI